MAIAAASSFSLEGACCLTSYKVTNSWMKSPFDIIRVSDIAGISCRNPFFGLTELDWLSKGHGFCLSKVSVAADYSDSVPDSSRRMSNRGYHPLEEIKVCRRIPDTCLSSAEIARTTVEANSNAVLIFPGMVHTEPHEQISWADFQYVVDDYGDLYFEVFDDANILEDRGASNPVNALIGMDISTYESRRIVSEFNGSESDYSEVPFDDDFFEVVEIDVPDIPVDWRMPDTSSLFHPIYFAKCLNKVVNMAHSEKMDHPLNGVSILGCLRPAFDDEEPYLRRLFYREDSEGYRSDWRGIISPEMVKALNWHNGPRSFAESDDETLRFESKSDRRNPGSIIYRLEIMRIELFSVYGVQSEISLQDFQDAEPDILVHSTPAIVERFNEKGIGCDVALNALCRKKGLHVEGAALIGVDSLGMDVRVFCGAEVRTHRFPFKIRATSEMAARKQIQQLLFPRSRRKKLFKSRGWY